MRILLVLVISVPMLASAQPGSEPAPEQKSHAVYSIRIGVQSTQFVLNDTNPIVRADDPPEGMGPLVDIEAGWRVNPRLSFLAFVVYSSIHDSDIQDPYARPVTYDVHDHLFDLGWRGRLHFADAFCGLGLGLQQYRESGYGAPFWDGGVFAELHAGYTFPKLGRWSPQIVVSAFYAPVKLDSLQSLRLAIGGQFE
jgi:hypothetical protein